MNIRYLSSKVGYDFLGLGSVFSRSDKGLEMNVTKFYSKDINISLTSKKFCEVTEPRFGLIVKRLLGNCPIVNCLIF